MSSDERHDVFSCSMACDERPAWRRYLPLVSLTTLLVSGTALLAFRSWGAGVVAAGTFPLVYASLLYFDRSRAVRFTINADALVVDGDTWLGDSFALESLDVPKSCPVDLSRTGPFSLKWKTLGTGLPGYYAGHYTLRGGDLAVVFVSDKHRVLYIPRTNGDRSLLLSVPDPDDFKRALLVAARRRAV